VLREVAQCLEKRKAKLIHNLQFLAFTLAVVQNSTRFCSILTDKEMSAGRIMSENAGIIDKTHDALYKDKIMHFYRAT
jgi:hypothetical protein